MSDPMCDHRWVRLVESAPDFPEDICVKCHMGRGHRVTPEPYRRAVFAIEDAPGELRGRGDVAVGTGVEWSIDDTDWRGEVTEATDGEWLAIVYRVPQDNAKGTP